MLIYLVLAWLSVDVNWARVSEGMERGLNFIASFLQPDFVSRSGEIFLGLRESLTMTLTSTVIGVALSIPIGLGAARNIAPLPVYLFCRLIIALSRTFQEIIIAIFFVAMVGFGPLAGVITLAFATVGFMAKLLAEDIEDARPDQMEAVRATGASWLQWINYAVQPQVMPESAITDATSAQQRTARFWVRSVWQTAPPLALPWAVCMPGVPTQGVEVQVWSASWPQPVPWVSSLSISSMVQRRPPAPTQMAPACA